MTLIFGLARWLHHLPVHKQVLLAAATTVFLIELILRSFARKSRFYARWTHAFETIGMLWTAVILAVVYFVSVALISAVARLLGKDLLDRKLDHEPTFWRTHEPNPLGALAAARHQF